MTAYRGFELAVVLTVTAAAIWLLWKLYCLTPAHVRRHELPIRRVRHMRARLRIRLRPGPGHATMYELWKCWGHVAAFRASRRPRPGLSFWQRLRRPHLHSVFLGRAQYRYALHTPLEDHILVISPPRKGKTGFIANAVMFYPGAVLSTTTRTDVFDLTSKLRSRRGPLHVFNPQALGALPSTFRWNIIDGCLDKAVAIRRADAFACAMHLEKGDNAFFQNAAKAYLRAMFHAAALVSGGDMRLVRRWALTGARGGAVEAEQILAQNGSADWAEQLSELRGAAEKTNANNQMVMTQTLGFLADPALAMSVMPAPGEGIDFEALIEEQGTLYMIANSTSDEAPLAPLFAALAGELHYAATMLAAKQPNGRLDPPLLMALDEIVQVCPVPLDKWVADSGGKGIQLIVVAHGEAHLAGRWGPYGKQAIFDCCGVKMFLDGISDVDTQRMISVNCGTTSYRVRGQDHFSEHDIVTQAMVRELPGERGLILRGNNSVVIVKLPRAWKNRQKKKVDRHEPPVTLRVPGPVQVPGPHAPFGVLNGHTRPASDASSAITTGELLPDPFDDTPAPWERRNDSA